MTDQHPVLATAKTADHLYAVRPKALRKLRLAVMSIQEPRMPRTVRAIPYGVRGWRYIAGDIPLAMAEGARITRSG